MADLRKNLEELRKKLLNLSLRNRFISFKIKPSGFCIPLTTTDPQALLDALEGDSVTLLPQELPSEEVVGANDLLKTNHETYTGVDDIDLEKYFSDVCKLNLSPEIPVDLGRGGLSERGDNLRVAYLEGDFSARMTTLFRAARLAEQERGTSIAFLIAGFLELVESDSSKKPFTAPLLTLPITITRNRMERGFDCFSIASDETASVNETLVAYLRQNFGFSLPERKVPEKPVKKSGTAARNTPSALERWFQEVDKAVQKADRRWHVRREMCLALMDDAGRTLSQDINPDNWPEDGLIENDLVQLVVNGENAEKETAGEVSTDWRSDSEDGIDRRCPLVLDADSSQLNAIANAIAGRNMVIEGPPGTGKSQTITNIIAALLAQGKSVLFMSEKLAALQVVHHKLDVAGLGDFCLEIHGRKNEKSQVIDSLRRRKQASMGTQPEATPEFLEKYALSRRALNQYVQMVNAPVEGTRYTVHEILSAAGRWHAVAQKLGLDLTACCPKAFLVDNECVHLLDDARIEAIRQVISVGGAILEELGLQTIDDHPWSGVTTADRSAATSDLIERSLQSAQEALTDLEKAVDVFASTFGGSAETISALSTRASFESLLKARLPELTESEEQVCIDTASVSSANLLAFTQTVEDFSRRLAELRKKVTDDFSHTERALEVSKLLDAVKGSYPENATFEEAETILENIEQLDKCCDDRIEEVIDVILPLIEGTAGNITDELLAIQFAAKVLPLADDLCGQEALTESLAIAFGRVLDKDPYGTFKSALQALEAKKDELAFETTNPPTVTEADRAWTVYKQGNFFKWFNSDWRAARRSIIGWNKKGSMSDATEHFDAWLSWLRDAENFTAHWKGVLEALQGTWTGIAGEHKSTYAIADWLAAVQWLGEQLDSPQRRRKVRGLARPERAFFDVFPRLTRISGVQTPSDFMAAYAAFTDADEWIATETKTDSDTKIGYRETPKLLSRIHAVAQAVERVANAAERQLLMTQVTAHMTLAQWREVAQEALRLQQRSVELEAAPVWALIQRLNPNLWEPVKPNELPKLKSIINTLSRVIKFRQSAEAVDLKFLGVPELTHLGEHLPHALRLTNAIDTLEAVREALCKKEEAFAKAGAVRDDWFVFSQGDATLAAQKARNARALENRRDLGRLTEFNVLTASLCNLGIESFWEEMQKIHLPLKDLENAYLAMAFHAVGAWLLETRNELGYFMATRQESRIETFRKLDEELKRRQAASIRKTLLSATLPQGRSGAKVSDYTEMKLIEHELGKKTRLIAPRELLKRSSEAVRALLPCFMMSPLAIAENLPPGAFKFDVVVMDEASQLRPEAALGAIARAKQAIIVGDPMQLPPTNFFRANGNSESEDEEEATMVTSESILDQAMNHLLKRRLLWHYRSRHEDLIRFSNDRFYDGQLVFFPSSKPNDPLLGVRRHRIADGVFRENKTNVEEARAIAEAVKAQVMAHPDESFGVVAMNVAQSTLLEDMIDQVRQASPESWDAFKHNDESQEPYFVKNLENVQGDERDVIFISMTYGPKVSGGAVPQRFGPINQMMGGRRLNVLFTRARKRMEIFTSMDSTDVLSKGGSGVAVLHDFLQFAETKQLPAAPGEVTGREPDSDFEVAVADALRARGLECTAQVGASGYFIDIAVRDPLDPTTFLLGIECDGATYHSSKSARDRDRLRGMVLEGLGWQLHHIWSTDWFNNPEDEIDRVVRKVDQLVKEKHGQPTNVVQDVPGTPETQAKQENQERQAPQQADAVAVTSARSVPTAPDGKEEKTEKKAEKTLQDVADAQEISVTTVVPEDNDVMDLSEFLEEADLADLTDVTDIFDEPEPAEVAARPKAQSVKPVKDEQWQKDSELQDDQEDFLKPIQSFVRKPRIDMLPQLNMQQEPSSVAAVMPKANSATSMTKSTQVAEAPKCVRTSKAIAEVKLPKVAVESSKPVVTASTSSTPVMVSTPTKANSATYATLAVQRQRQEQGYLTIDFEKDNEKPADALDAALLRLHRRYQQEFKNVSPEGQLLNARMRKFFCDRRPTTVEDFNAECPERLRAAIDPQLLAKHLRHVFATIEKQIDEETAG